MTTTTKPNAKRSRGRPPSPPSVALLRRTLKLQQAGKTIQQIADTLTNSTGEHVGKTKVSALLALAKTTLLKQPRRPRQKHEPTMTLRGLSPSAIATLLAALREWQRRHKDLAESVDAFPEHFADHPPLDNDEIDTLCQSLNQASGGC